MIANILILIACSLLILRTYEEKNTGGVLRLHLYLACI